LDNANEAQWTTVAASLFNKRYFENTLGWNFDKVWEWDEQKDHPVLRQNAGAANPQTASAGASNANTVDLLTQQIRNNIWL
jgi:MoxR-like ATPase